MFKDGAPWLLLLDDLTTNNPTPIGLVKAAVTVSGQNFSCTGKRYMLPVAVFTVALNENCAGTTRQYSGVALQNSAKDQTTFGLVLQDQSVGTIAVAAKVVTPS